MPDDYELELDQFLAHDIEVNETVDRISRTHQLVCDGEAIPIMEATILALQSKCACARCIIRTLSAIAGSVLQYVPARQKQAAISDMGLAAMLYGSQIPNKDYRKILGGQCMKPGKPREIVGLGDELAVKLLGRE